jgi:hypothetical protein
MDADDRDRLDPVEQTHGPSITWGPDGAVGYACACGGPWPCEVLRRADDARRHRDRVARDAGRAGVVRATSRPPMRRRQPDPEYPDRPYVRDIYDAQLRGFPIFDGDAFEVYRVALTSPIGLTDDPEAVEVLRPLAQQARAWLEQNPDAPVRPWWAPSDR